ncbi:MAG: protein kinase [Ktedonobacteraceae bacterium]
MSNRVGQQLGDYRLLRLLGEGHETQVYLGEHVVYRTLVAIKCPVSNWGDALQCFTADVQTAQQLKHRSIARVFANGTQDSTPFLAMEYAPGGNMRQPKGSCLSLTTVVPYVQQLSSALQYAHERQFMHRSLLPENILLGAQNDLLLADFTPYIDGTSVLPTGQPKHSVKSQAYLYMAPEKVQGHPIPASDQYALAAIVYEWLCGVPPFDDIAAALYGEPIPLRQRLATLSPAAEIVLLVALARKAEYRFASIQGFANALTLALKLESGTSATTAPFDETAPVVPGKQRTRPLPVQLVGPIEVTDTKDHTEDLAYVEDFSARSHEFTYKRHTAAVKAVQWSPDGKFIASAGADGTVQVWDASIGKHVVSHSGHEGTVNTLAWSPINAVLDPEQSWRIASAGEDTTVQLWNVVPKDYDEQSLPRTDFFTYRGHADEVHVVVWSSDGSRIASAGAGTTVQVWEAVSGKELLTYRGHLNSVRALVWSPDGSRIASVAGDTTVHIWHASTGEPYVEEDIHTHPINALAWSPDGRRIASGDSENSVCIWDPAPDPENTLVVPEYSDFTAPVLVLAWSPDGTRLAGGCADGTVRVKEVFSFKYADSLVHDGHTDAVNALSWSPDSTHIASASDDETVHVWFVPPRIDAMHPYDEAEAYQEKTAHASPWDMWPSTQLVAEPSDVIPWTWGQPPTSPLPSVPTPTVVLPAEATLYRYHGHMETVTTVVWSPQGNRLASASNDGMVMLWDAFSGANVLVYAGHRGPVRSVAWSPTGERLASAGEDGTIQLWDASTGTHLWSYHTHESAVNAVAWSPDGRYLASASDDTTVQVWDAVTAQHLFTYRGHVESVHLLGWSCDSQRIASAGKDSRVHVWEATTGLHAFVYRHPENVHALAWSPHRNSIAVVGANNMVLLWEAIPESTMSGFSTPFSAISTLAWSPDGLRLALAGSSGEVLVCEAGTGKNMLLYQEHNEQVTSLAWSPDSKCLASVSADKTVAVWTTTILDSICPYRGHSASVYLLAWSPDGMCIASAGADHTVQVWDTTTGTRFATYQQHRSWIQTIVWQPDGKTLLSCTIDDERHMWDATTGSTLSAERLAAEHLERHSDHSTLVVKSANLTYTAYVYADGVVEIADTATGHLIQVYRGHTGTIPTLLWSSDTRIASVGRAGIVHIWDGLTGNTLCSLQSPAKTLRPLEWSPDGARILTSDADNTLQVWNTTTGRCVCTYTAHTTTLYATIWSPDGHSIASASDILPEKSRYAVQVWDATTGNALCRYEGHDSRVASIRWSPPVPGACGFRIATVGLDASGEKSSTIHVWDATTGTCITRYEAHTSAVNAVTWSPTGTRIASASDDQTVRIWDVVF